MICIGPGRALALALVLVATPLAGDILSVDGERGGELLSIDMPDGGEWCLRWNHSVTGGRVVDCFRNEGGTMMLARSYLHDYAAGLGELAGRGRTVSAPEGGYWILDIDARIPGNALPLRVGQPRVGHRITADGASYDLSAEAAGQRVILRLAE